MGILNLTPDSFSGDGIYKDPGRAVEEAIRMKEDGADIIDIGGESTRPFAEEVPLEEELERVVPVVKRVAKFLKIPISVDTRKSEVAQEALDNGASIVNDISGLEFDKKMVDVVRHYNAGVVIMHIKGTPQTMQVNPVYSDVIVEIIEKLSHLVNYAEENGIDRKNIIIDPGIGFGKTFEHNLEILANLGRFRVLDRPILIGVSRKSFIGKILNLEPKERVFGSIAAAVIAVKNGADIIRTHDVRQTREAVMVADAIIRSGEKLNV